MFITVEKIVYPGKALGRGQDGIATFVDGALPGEEVDVEIRKKKKSYQEGKLISIITPSKQRTVSRCPSFGKCGGCSFQHTDYENQLSIKESYVHELLSPYCSNIQPIIPSPEIWRYRNKMEFSFFEMEGQPSIGLHEKGQWNRYFAVPPCYIADSDFLPIVEQVQSFARSSSLQPYNPTTHNGFWRHLVLRKTKRTNQILINIVTNSNNQVSQEFFHPLLSAFSKNGISTFWSINSSVSDTVQADKLILLSGQDHIEEEMLINNKKYYCLISPFSFFQTNSLGAEKLYETVLHLLTPRKNDTVVDLYCGTGIIGLTIAPYVHRVVGVEQGEDAIKNAIANKEKNKIPNITFEVGSVEKWIQHSAISSLNSLILDPPRSGVSNKVIDFIVGTKPEKLIYVSCDPATLAKDLKELGQKAGYKVLRAIPLDMFPQTYHVETVAELGF